MQGSIKSYATLKSCEICQLSKTHTLKPTCMLQLLDIPDMNREVVNMDLIFGLTPSTHGYDVIFVCL